MPVEVSASAGVGLIATGMRKVPITAIVAARPSIPRPTGRRWLRNDVDMGLLSSLRPAEAQIAWRSRRVRPQGSREPYRQGELPLQRQCGGIPRPGDASETIGPDGGTDRYLEAGRRRQEESLATTGPARSPEAPTPVYGGAAPRGGRGAPNL